MHGIGPPLVTPFTDSDDLDESRLRELIHWLETRSVDFLVPCGSTSESELMTLDERRRVIEIVTEEASVPVLAGAGHPGYRETMRQIEGATAAGVDGVMVVTPFYYPHDQQTLATYYRDVADEASVPIYLYSVPPYTHITLEPETVGELGGHPNIVGMKDSLGDLGTFIRTHDRTKEHDFDLLTGSANLLDTAPTHGASGAILALANLAPRHCSEAFTGSARTDIASLVELNTAITATHGIPGLKWAMRHIGAPAGYPRRPFQPPDDDAIEEIDSLLSRCDLA